MRIPELAYSDELDARVYADTAIALGGLHLAVEATTISGKARPNEDAFAFSRQGDILLAGVFDGAVGREVSNLARHYMEDGTATTGRGVLSEVNAALANHDLQGGGSTGTIIDIRSAGQDRGLLDVGHVSDSWALFRQEDGPIHQLTRDQHVQFDEQALAVLARVAREQNISLSEARHHPEVEEALSHMFRTCRNTPDGSGAGILNGSRHMDQYIQTLDEPITLRPGSRILIGSDGSLLPRSPYSRFTLEKMFSIVANHGTDVYLNHVRTEEAEHRPTVKHPRWSLHDDKTLVDIRVL
jgi:serine/threonine protein phosphatase PrpC